VTGPRRAPVMKDVARLAGVSHITVSRVINGAAAVRPETRERVLSAMTELGYRPNLAARALVTRRSHTLGVIAIGTTLFGPASTLLSIEQAARARGYYLSVVSVDAMTTEALDDALERLAKQGVEGLVVMAPRRAAVDALSAVPHHLPTVTVEGGGASGTPAVLVDQAGGAAAVTEHLVALGHRRIAHLAGPADWLEAQARLDGWRAACRAAGLPAPRPLRGDWSPRSGYRAGRRLLDRLEELTAVFAANDQMALGVLRAFAEAGVRVPEDVSVAGFDDVPEAEYLHPPLTTVRQDFEAVGRHCVELLTRSIEEPDDPRPPGPVVVPARLVVRGSTGAARTTAPTPPPIPGVRSGADG
jgi:DNA-binding LacI/PurR family transcriptional regulator